MELDHINTLGLATTIISAPVFTGIYTLGSMLRLYATTAMINTFSANQAETITEQVKLIPSTMNAIALRASNSVVAVKQVVEPICEAIKPQPLMIAPPRATPMVILNNINKPNSYGNIFRYLVDGYRIYNKIKNGEYLQASAYCLSMAIDYSINDTLSLTAEIYAESITGSSSAGLLVKGIVSMSTSIALREIISFFSEDVYSYYCPTAAAAEQNFLLFANEPVVIVKKEENNNVNANVNTNSATTKAEAEHKPTSTTPEKKKPSKKVRRENSNERQFRRKLAALGVIEQDNTENNNVVSETVSASSEKKPVRQPRRMTSKERRFDRKLAELMISTDENKKQEKIQDENKYIEPNYDAFLNRKNDYDFIRHSDKKEQAPLTDITNVAASTIRIIGIPTPAQRRDARLVKKAGMDGSPHELGKKSFKDNGCHFDLNMTVTNTKSLRSENKNFSVINDDAAPILDGAKALCDAVVNLLTLSPVKPVVTPARNLNWEKESAEFWRQTAQRSETRMKKAGAHLQDLLKYKQYITPDMIERAQSTFNDCKEMYEKDRDYLNGIPKL